MKKLFSILATITIGFFANAQCASGDCVNGFGIINYSDGGKYEGNFVNNLKEGKGTLVSKNGDKYIGDFKNNLRDGKGKYIWSGGIIYEGDWVDNIRNGKGKVIFLDGTTQEGIYVKNIYMEGSENFTEDQLEIKKTYDEKGKIASEIAYFKGKKNGVYKIYFKGKPFVESTYVNDKENGIRKEYNKGKIWREYGYVNDIKNGIEREYLDGKLNSERTYVNGIENGIYKDYLNGELFMEVTVVNGKWNGVKKDYNQGQLYEETTYVNGKKSGVFKHYLNNKVFDEKMYANDIVVSVIMENGKLVGESSKGECISGDCQNGYGVILYKGGTKYFGMCVNMVREGFGYTVYPDKVTYEYESLYSLKQVKITTPGDIYYGYWKNDGRARSFNSMDEFSGVVYRELNGEYTHFMDYFFNTNMANSEAERKRIDRENEAAYGLELMKKMKNVSITPSSTNKDDGHYDGETTVGPDGRTILWKKKN
jgi:antitoxin component YwqK of YwqJK toxin-antitoxin module